jgi:hypothetical protein
MPVPKDFANQIEDATTQALVARGFRRRKRGIVTLPVEKLIQGWVGLNTALFAREDALLINPVVGIRHDLVEQIVAEVDHDKPHAYTPPTVSMNVGYTRTNADSLDFEFTPSAPPEPTIRALTDAIVEHGIPFMKSGADSELLLEILRKDVPFRGHASPRLLVLEFLRGAGAAELRTLATERGVMEFADRFLARLSTDGARWQKLAAA